MKRIPAFQTLSKEHHQALVMASRCRKTGDSETEAMCADYWRQMQLRFAEELEPHFRLEERILIPALQRLDEQALERQLIEEHRQLQELIAGDDNPRQRLLDYGTLLAGHVRFEERSLFERLQESMLEEELEQLSAAT